MVMLHVKLVGVKNASTLSQIFLLQPPPTTLGMGSIGQNMVIVAYQTKGITKCSNTVANILAADPLPSWGSGQEVKFNLNLWFGLKGKHSECGHKIFY